jgi:hypothetical protein
MSLEVVKSSHRVNTFGFPLSNRECRVCHGKMYRVASGEKLYGGKRYGFEGYKCGFCGHEHVEHTNGGVLGHVKE